MAEQSGVDVGEISMVVENTSMMRLNTMEMTHGAASVNVTRGGWFDFADYSAAHNKPGDTVCGSIIKHKFQFEDVTTISKIDWLGNYAETNTYKSEIGNWTEETIIPETDNFCLKIYGNVGDVDEGVAAETATWTRGKPMQNFTEH